MKKFRLSRRTLLRGALAGTSVGLALPPLEAMYNDNGSFADASEEGPIFGVFYWANGLPWHAKHGAEQGQGNFPDHWTPATTGAGYAATPLLTPIAGHQVSVATGLEPHTAIPATPPGQGDGHMRGFMVALTGDRIRPEGFDHPSHTLTCLRPTLDQYVANHADFYGATLPRFKSLVMGVSEARFHEYGHWNAVSFNGPDEPNLPILDPGALYDHLFTVSTGNETSLTRRARLLDAVMADAGDLRKRLGASDKTRLDAHLAHLDEIQRRLDLGAGTCEAPGVPSPTNNLLAKTSIMGELLAVALGCGLTRVFSFMLTSPASTHIFSNLGVADGMHKACHDGDWQDVYNVTEHHMQAFARLLDELAAVQDPMGNNLMDRVCILGVSEYGEGWKHGVKEMPVLIAGGADGAINRGVHYREAGGNISKAHVTVLRALGIDTPSYGFNGGETTEALSGILA